MDERTFLQALRDAEVAAGDVGSRGDLTDRVLQLAEQIREMRREIERYQRRANILEDRSRHAIEVLAGREPAVPSEYTRTHLDPIPDPKLRSGL